MEYKNYWLERRAARKERWKRIELFSTASWMMWKESAEKHREKYAGKSSELIARLDPDLREAYELAGYGCEAAALDWAEAEQNKRDKLEPEVVFLAYEDRDPEILRSRNG